MLSRSGVVLAKSQSPLFVGASVRRLFPSVSELRTAEGAEIAEPDGVSRLASSEFGTTEGTEDTEPDRILAATLCPRELELRP